MAIPQSPIFVSHSYADSLLTTLLVTRLPATAKTVIFPAIQVPPTETVSARLLESIRECRSFVWIDTAHARQSHWVTLERDYACRAGLHLFRFDVEGDSIQADSTPLLELPAFSSYAYADRTMVAEIVQLMKNRYLDIFYDTDDVQAGGLFIDQIARGLTTRLDAGGYCIAFWSRSADRSRYVREELQAASVAYPDRILPVRLDRTPLPAPLNRRQAFEILTPSGAIDLRLVDNLIVWIYWTIGHNREAQG